MLEAYLVIAGSFSIASYFFIHLKALKKANINNDILYSISYIIISFIFFIPITYIWLSNSEAFIKGLYSERVYS